jgi:hypothetical protein
MKVAAFLFILELKLELRAHSDCLQYKGRMNVRVFERKQRQALSIIPVPRPTKGSPDFEVSPGAIRNSFHGWLNKVTDQAAVVSIKKPLFRTRLSVLDIMRVNHATIREGESHCIWPPSVVQKFQLAKVITDKKAQHYQLKDQNLRRVN